MDCGEQSPAGHPCAVCGNAGRGTCSWCLCVHYCSTTCQQQDWLLAHSSACSANQQAHSSTLRCAGTLLHNSDLADEREPLAQVESYDLPEQARDRIATISRAAGRFTAAIRETQLRLDSERQSVNITASACDDDRSVGPDTKRPGKIPWSWKSSKKEHPSHMEVAQQEAELQAAVSAESTSDITVATDLPQEAAGVTTTPEAIASKDVSKVHGSLPGASMDVSKVHGSAPVISEVATPSRKVCAPTTPEPKTIAVSTGRASLGGEPDVALGQEANMSVNEEEDKLVESPTKANFDQALVAWRREVNTVTSGPTSSEEEAEEVEELLVLLEDDSSPRFAVTVEGVRPMLVTAPHCIALLRDGQPAHLVEEYTAAIAQALTQKVNGTSLMWTPAEQRRVELLWSFGKKRGNGGWQLLDPQNRDPNFLSALELAQNPWHQLMLRTAVSWRTSLHQDVSMLHVDVHGCRDPPHTPSHLTVGLGAMLTEARNSGVPERVSLVKAFGEALEEELTKVLTSMRLWPKVQMIRVIVPTAWDKHMRFAGAWAPSTQRHTQTQQAVSYAGFAYSVQLEMSKTLRRALLQNRPALDEFGGALIAAWKKAEQGDTKDTPLSADANPWR